jgi:hypothetical protein
VLQGKNTLRKKKHITEDNLKKYNYRNNAKLIYFIVGKNLLTLSVLLQLFQVSTYVTPSHDETKTNTCSFQ